MPQYGFRVIVPYYTSTRDVKYPAHNDDEEQQPYASAFASHFLQNNRPVYC